MNDCLDGDTQGNDVYIVRLAASGVHVASAAFGGVGLQMANGLAVSGLGQRAIVGQFEATLDFGFGPVNASYVDGYLTLFNP